MDSPSNLQDWPLGATLSVLPPRPPPSVPVPTSAGSPQDHRKVREGGRLRRLPSSGGSGQKSQIWGCVRKTPRALGERSRCRAGQGHRRQSDKADARSPGGQGARAHLSSGHSRLPVPLRGAHSYFQMGNFDLRTRARCPCRAPACTTFPGFLCSLPRGYLESGHPRPLLLAFEHAVLPTCTPCLPFLCAL